MHIYIYISYFDDLKSDVFECLWTMLGRSHKECWVFITGGCSGRGVQWIGVVLYSKTAYDIM